MGENWEECNEKKKSNEKMREKHNGEGEEK